MQGEEFRPSKRVLVFLVPKLSFPQSTVNGNDPCIRLAIRAFASLANQIQPKSENRICKRDLKHIVVL